MVIMQTLLNMTMFYLSFVANVTDGYQFNDYK
jgi:hypothetical protein